MTAAADHPAELYELAGAQCEGTIAPEQAARLEELVLGDERLRRRYVLYMQVHACAEQGGGSRTDVRHAESAFRDSGELYPSPGTAISPLPSLSGTHYQLSANFVGGPVFSYMVATVILCAMLLGAWAYKISHDEMVAQDKPAINSIEDTEYKAVGRVTGMRDCVWGKDSLITMVGASVPMGRKYILSSGLMEITYASGAKVIVEGPCTYKVESESGGYLSLGKLTARVETKGSGQDTGNPRLSTQHSPHFFVRTPTAVVTDLGTEFGVEVSKDGNTMSYVFRGSVRVQVLPHLKNQRRVEGKMESILLVAGESARVEKTDDGPRIVHSEPSKAPNFVCVMPPPRIGLLDLADVVAGGDGAGRAKQRGIDATSGRVVESQIYFYGTGDGGYHPVEALPFIDGVFVPDGGAGPVQLDSVGHRTSVLTDTNGNSWNFIWSGHIPFKTKKGETNPIPVNCRLGGIDYDGRGHSAIAIPPNKGITFDLDAIRRANPEMAIARFTTVAGNSEERSWNRLAARVSADLWVFVDGELRFSKTDVNSTDGPFKVDIPLTPKNRFLTLVATDAGNSEMCDWTMFGDPRLKLQVKKEGSANENNIMRNKKTTY